VLYELRRRRVFFNSTVSNSVLFHSELHPDSKINCSIIEQSGGLTNQQAQKRLAVVGPNILTPPAKIPEWRRLLKQFQNTFLLLLLGSATLSIVAFFLDGDLTNLYLAIVLFSVVFLTGYVQVLSTLSAAP